MRGTSTIAGLASLFLLVSGNTHGQVPAKVEFEVASIKPHPGSVTIQGLSISGTKVEETAVSLSDLVIDAYHVRSEQVSGGPEWSKSTLFDIQGKAVGGEPTTALARLMVQSLLADRFKLVVRREAVEMPVYALVAAKSGSQLNPSTDPVGIRTWGTENGRHMEGSVSLEFLVRQLTGIAGRQVVDRTGLTGNFKIALDWTPEGFRPPDAITSVSIFTAVQEQLGLRLESSRAPVEMLVIEHAERPDTD